MNMNEAELDEVLEDEGAKAGNRSSSEGGGRALALDGESANRLAAHVRPTVVVLAGATGSGKTSVYAALYERLGRGPFAGWCFAGSATIPGFEQRCHWWRSTSGGSEPFMEHTRANDLPWLHIRLRDLEGRRSVRELLFGDFDGEIFEQFRDARMRPDELRFLRRADHVGLVLDGARIAAATTLASELNQARYLLDRLLNTDALAGPSAFSILVTKTDWFESLDATNRKRVEDSLAGFNAEASVAAGQPVPLLRLAVRSTTSSFPLGHGLETLLEVISLRPTLEVGNPSRIYRPVTSMGRFA